MSYGTDGHARRRHNALFVSGRISRSESIVSMLRRYHQGGPFPVSADITGAMGHAERF